MISLIDLEEAKGHLRVTGTNADEDLTAKMFMATAILFNYLKIDPDASPLSVPWGTSDWAGDEPPWDIKAACLLILGDLWAYREGSTLGNFREMNPISPAIESLLRRWRDPSMA